MTRRTLLGNLGALSALLALGLIGFTSSYGGWWFMVPAMGGAVAGLAIGWLAKVRAWSAATTAAVVLAAFLLLGGPLALPETTIAGVIPTLDTVRGLIDGAIAGWKQLITTVPPVGSTPPLLVVPFVTGLVGGVLGASLALRSRRAPVPVVAALTVLSAGILVGTRFPVSVVLQGAVFGAIAAAWIAWRHLGRSHAEPLHFEGGPSRRRAAGAVAMLAVAGVLSVPLGPLLPMADARPRFTLREQAQPPIDPAAYATPLGSMRNYSTTLHDQTLFTVTGLPAGANLRLATMDFYDGLVWGVAGSATGELGSSGTFEQIGSQPTTPATGDVHSVDVTIGAYHDYWLPDAGVVSSIEFSGDSAAALAKGLRYNLATGTGLSTRRLAEGDTYTLQVALPELPSPEDAAQLPVGVHATPAAPAIESVKELQGALRADSEAEGTPGFYQQISALATSLREGYYSNGDTAVGRPPSLSGHGTGRLSAFAAAEPLIGDEEQYAAVAALMTSYLGVPVRLVMGAQAPEGSEAGWDVKGEDITAWIEAGLGDTWIPFAVVPDKERLPPDTQEVKQRPQLAPQQPLPPPPPDTSEAVVASEVEAPDAEEDPDGDWAIPGAVLVALRFVGIPLLLAGLVIGGMAGAKAWRRKRRRTRGQPSTKIAGGWSEVTGIVRDFGTELPRGTRREAAIALGLPSATALAESADEAVFGPQAPTNFEAEEFWGNVDAFHRDIRRQHPWYRRLRAILSIGSWRS